MSLPSLGDYCIPDNTAEAIALLDQYGDSAMIVAGGTFVHGLEARGLLGGLEALIDIGNLGLDRIDESGPDLRLGATATLADALTAKAISGNVAYGAIVDALAYPPAQIRNVGTVGGCLAASAPLYDLPGALLALDGVAEVIGPGGQRHITLGEFFTGLFENALASNEIITAVTMPACSTGTTSAFLKLETNANDLAIVNVAVRFRRDNDRCSDSRVVVGGGVGETYVRAVSAEDLLNGAPAEPASFIAAAEAVAADIEPISDHRASSAYRRHIAKIYTRRTLEKALERLD
jgi:carbon-monoxide dehydrogenase medium subunit